MKYCDCCYKSRRDVVLCGSDPDGNPDLPGVCFLCRKEYQRGRVYSGKYKKYISIEQYEYELYGNYDRLYY